MIEPFFIERLYMKRITFIILFLGSISWSQNIEDISMLYWSSESGLPNNRITDLSQDYKGFMWIGTNKGLFRFDGKNFFNVTYQNKDFNVNVSKLMPYKESIYFLSVSNEIYKVNIHNLICTKIKTDQINDNDLTTILNKIKFPKVERIKKNTFQLLENGDVLIDSKKETGTYNAIFKDSHNNLWIANRDGSVGYWSTQKKQIIYVSPQNAVMSVQRFVEDEKDKVWFSFRRRDNGEFNSGGVGFWDLNQKQLYTLKNIQQHPYINDSGDVFSTLYDLEITALFFDCSGNLWIGTATKGLFRVRFKKKAYQFFKLDGVDQPKITKEDISHPSVLSNGDIWSGTWGAGVNILKKQNLLLSHPPFEAIPLANKEGDLLKDDQVYPIFEDSRGVIWVGTTSNGLYKLTKQSKVIKKYHYQNYNVNNSKLLSNTITGIYEDKSGTLWICTNNGLVRYNPDSKQFENSFKELKNPNIFKNVWMFSVFQDSQDNLWVTTRNNGLYKWSKKQNRVTNLKTTKEYSTDSIMNVIEAPKGSIWFAGFKNLFNYNLKNNAFEHKVSPENFGNNNIASMMLGEDERLWLGTYKGLYAYTPISKSMEHIDFPIGIRRNSFTRGASQDKDGYLHYGTRNGFYRFHPLKLSFLEKNKPLHFVNLKIKGENYIDYKKKNNIINKDIAISNRNELTLNHNNNAFSLEFSPLDYALEDINHYETSMTKEGEESYWISTSNNSVSWGNLETGSYTFKVKKRNSGLESMMHITILPPWWQTIWFKVAALFSFILITFLIIKAIFNREQYKRTIEFEKKSLKDQIELDNQQLRFFTNLSHEIRTPLTLILSPLEEIMKNASKNEHITNLKLIKKSVLRITRLVNRGIDFRKTEYKKIELEAEELDIIAFLKPLINDFSVFSAGKNIEVVFKYNQDKMFFWFDQYMMETIIYNLLSNAIKYSFTNSKVLIEVIKENSNVSIKVIDYGRGINEKDLDQLFERFYQTKAHIKGSGIGLALVKRFAEAHKATINVKSSEGKGSCFELKFPLGVSHIPDEQKKSLKINPIIPNAKGTEPVSSLKKDSLVALSNSTILIVEDETDLREYLETHLAFTYKIITAKNGIEALELIGNNKIDVVVSDIMMPKMDGLELCETLKNNPKTNNIPIILLTAKTLNTDKIIGFNKGADAYIDKPFNLDVLKSRINNILENQIRITNNFLELLNVDINIETINNSDKEFYNKTLTILESHIDNPSFDIPLFTKEIGMSKSVVYKKMSNITNVGINDLMLKLRLNRASYLLSNTSKSITEIAFHVGFKDAKYFSKCFKKQFNETPTAYRNAQIKTLAES
jgi:signal transduction histidine kinase/DNA-binding response OmpR family regulator/ligand-binding sensor domain-containing protein